MAATRRRRSCRLGDDGGEFIADDFRDDWLNQRPTVVGAEIITF